MKQKHQNSKPIIGFFVVFTDESTILKKERLVNSGRSGIFYNKEDLVTTINSKAIPKDKMDVVEIAVTPDIMIHPKLSNPDEPKRFGIVGGKNVKVRKIRPFAEVMEEILADVA